MCSVRTCIRWLMMIHGDLFAGIGGFALAAQRVGLETKWMVEIDEFCRKVYAKHFPDVKQYGDIKEVETLPYVDLLTGGFPCQPFSVVGRREGTRDDRYLWPDMLRIIRAVNPRWVVAENVPGIDDKTYMVLDTVLDDLESSGYQAVPIEIPACAVGAPHLRQRVWIVAYTRRTGRQQESRGTPCDEETNGGERRFILQQDKDYIADGNVQIAWPPGPSGVSQIPRVAHGIPARVDRLKALGNAIVPQVAEWIIRRMMEGRDEAS